MDYGPGIYQNSFYGAIREDFRGLSERADKRHSREQSVLSFERFEGSKKIEKKGDKRSQLRQEFIAYASLLSAFLCRRRI